MNKRLEWNSKCDPKDFQRYFKNFQEFLKFQRYFPFMERIVIQSSRRRALKSYYFFCILTFFRPPCLKSEHKVSFFIFGLEGHRKVFCILSSSLIISVGTFDINERKTIFEIAKVLKTIILPSSVRRRIPRLRQKKHSEFLLCSWENVFHFAFPCCKKTGFQ